MTTSESSYKKTEGKSGENLTFDESKELNLCAKKCLGTLATFQKRLSRTTLAVYSKYRHTSGGFKAACKTLRISGYADENKEGLQITPLGVQRAGIVEVLPSNPKDLLDSWMDKLATCPGKLLQHLTEIFPSTTDRSTLAGDTGYSPTSGGFKAGIKLLVDLGLITENGGAIQASREMFPGVP